MTKEVRFDIYCKQCVYCNKSPSDKPCSECLGDPSNEGSHVPKNFKKAKAFINYRQPDPNVDSFTRDHMKSEKWVDREPTDAELKLYFTKKGEDWYENR